MAWLTRSNHLSSRLFSISLRSLQPTPPTSFPTPSRNLLNLHHHHKRSLTTVPGFRNVAIVAHVDHGKTTLVDALLSACGSGSSLNARTMDSDDLEKERGITILSKVTSLSYKDTTINLVDTPGHTDFAGEVERALSMVDGVCLVVDATDGPMAQTKYVLQKALGFNLKPLVVINKVDRPTARVDAVEDEILDLFCSLECSDEQLEYRTIYACGKEGWASSTKGTAGSDMSPLLDAILDSTPAPKVEHDDDEFRLLVSMMESDDSVHLGKVLLTGKVISGQAGVTDKVKILKPESAEEPQESSIVKILKRDGLNRRELDACVAGDIVTLAGVVGGRVADTICSSEVLIPLEAPKLDPPTISVLMSVNDSKLSGDKELSGGTKLTSQMIKERLLKEAESNIAIRLGFDGNYDERDSVCIFGRGEMQLGILFETMRREGYEMSISPPQAIFKTDEKTGALLEPIEEVTVITDEEYAGLCIQALIARKGEMINSALNVDGKQLISFTVPSRCLVGLRSELIRDCSGNAIVTSLFHSYQKHRGAMDNARKGVLISSEDGTASEYALSALEPRGTLFLSRGQKVYQGMLVGEHSRSNDLDVNPTKEKKLTNVRAGGKDESTKLSPPRVFQLEDCIGYIQQDELIEITPKGVRMRKAILDPSKRKAKGRKK